MTSPAKAYIRACGCGDHATTQHLPLSVIDPQDIHMDIRAIKSPAVDGLPDVRMATLPNDIIMETARSGTTVKNGKFQLWERELLESSEIRRKSTVAQLCTWCHARIQFVLKSSL